ncbi:L-aminopeptidase/D-esterase-like protein [Aureimonas jatrophae]|uniref:L-aminopeptidase/D-esterase n=1 Tax=Aureimonas jatrophae TaxID=1166073 RepID=A0A1H0JKB8_9HYPH|nr:P1 family peptidase [Aureimonas jatrophae]MBB3951373.1 L-aminopeptidase/D-esterase-like protein [Aureimonas jatrophae]SDO43869.1 L-aminopeptidase/D-esterase [Aureimonas jatrophae]
MSERWRAGPRNRLTDVAGLRVGHASSERLRSGVTAILCDRPTLASVAVLGGAPGTRETDLLAPDATVAGVDALVLSGGSAFGLDAASGVQSVLRGWGRGFAVGAFRVPIVPAAILFDLANGGDKDWGDHSPYRDLGVVAAQAAALDFELGGIGAGLGATTAACRGGLGSASVQLPNGATIAALVAVNALGSPLVGSTRHFRAAPFEIGGEFGGLGLPHPLPDDVAVPRSKIALPGTATTIAVIATDLHLDKASARRLALAAHDGFALALWPVHTDYDGDLVFALATGERGPVPDGGARVEVAAAASSVMARAVARAVFATLPLPGDTLPAWTSLAG